MAAKTDGDWSGCTFQWKIENKSHCWLKKGEAIESPTFIADALEGTRWSLSLYPMGERNENNFGFYLHREIDCSELEVIVIKYQLALLGKNDSILKEITSSSSFQKPKRWGFPNFAAREKMFVTETETFLIEDTLTVQCTIWNKEEKPVKPQLITARTVYKANKRSFVWIIDKFSTLKSGLKNKFKDNLIEFDLALKEQDFEKKLIININWFDKSIKCFSFKNSIVDSEEKKENCGNHEYFTDDLKRGVLSMPLFTKKLIEDGSRYLPNDVLSLGFECSILTETVLYEFFSCGKTASKLTNVVENRNEHDVGKVISQSPSVLVDDLKPIYNNSILCDTELRTLTQTFPAHKIILIARSPVFRKMFSNDMKEKSSGHVDITDLEDDTVHRMLLYMYADSLEDLQIESAFKLYAAADKYQILYLRSLCSSFLKDNLCLTKVCDVLALADLHQDNDLKSFVQDYVLEHDKEVFGSQEWKDFMESNLKLAADIMYLKVYPR